MFEKNTLDSMNLRELGSELKKVREKRGLTQQDVADALGVARTTMTAIENGDRRIRAAELVQLARIYGVDVGEFVRETRPRTEPFGLQFRSTYRKRDSGSEPTSDSLDEFETLSKNYVELEHIVAKPMKYNYPSEDLYHVSNQRIEQAAEFIAVQERVRLGLGDGPISNLREVLEREVGLRIFYIKIAPSRFAAMYAYDPLLGGCIAINADHPIDRGRWSLAHEYAHFLIHRQEPDLVGNTYNRVLDKDRFADAFAQNFLMPSTSINRQIGSSRISRTDLFRLANTFGVSVEAFTRRLEGMKIIPVGTWDDMKRKEVKVRDIQLQLGLANINEPSEKLPKRYRYLAIEAYGQGLITEGQFTTYLQVNRVEARRIMEEIEELDEGYFDLSSLNGLGKDA